MSFSRNPIYAATILTLALSAFSCSTSPPAGEGNAEGALPAPESNADQVGSIPEDMLADEKGVENAGAATPLDTAEATPQSDPFSDLKENDEPSKSANRDSLEVPEDSGGGGQPKGKGKGSKHAVAAPVHDAGGSGSMERYSVKSGDTLMKIAFHLYGDVERWKELQELNQSSLKNANQLRNGMQLRYEVPNEPFNPDQLAKSYEIKKGDTLAGIADEVYGKKMKYKKLQTYNQHLIKNPNRIFAGFTIYYDITDKEMAEAETRRSQRAAGGGGSPPSAISPPAEVAPAPKNVATTPQATDNSAVQGPTAGPPSPGN